MEVKRIYCDRCKKEITGLPVVDCCKEYPLVITRRPIDLCNECRKELGEWLKGENK